MITHSVPMSRACKKQTAVSHSTEADAGLKMEGLLALTLWENLMIDALEPYASRARRFASSQTQNAQKTHVGIRWQGTTKHATCMHHISQLWFFLVLEASSFNGSPDRTIRPPVVWKSRVRQSHGNHARNPKVQRRPNGPIILSSQEVWQQILNYLRKTHRKLQSWSRSLARAELRTEHTLYSCELPDSATSSSCAPWTDEIDEDDLWSPHWFCRSGWPNVSNRLNSVTAQLWFSRPHQSWQRRWQNLWWTISVRSNRLSRFLVVTSVNITAAHFQSLPNRFRLLRILRDDVSKLEGTSSKSIPKEKTLSHWSQCDIRSAHFWSRTDTIRCSRPGEPKLGRPFAFPRCPSTGRPVANGSTIRRQSRPDIGWSISFPRFHRKSNHRAHHLSQYATSLKIPVPKHLETDCSLRWKN